MKVPTWVMSAKEGSTPLSPTDYYACFEQALRRMSKFLYGRSDHYELHSTNRDDRISDDESAREHFYSGFKIQTRRSPPTINYTLSQAFFKYSYHGLYVPDVTFKKKDESDKAFIVDCATNYLVKNFWHNYVHDRAQRITDENYHLFRHESRYYSDFEADGLANILLPLSYGLKVAADQSDLRDPRPEIANLYGRNRCNRVFVLREKARKNSPASGKSYDSLQDWEWLIRRRFTNQLAMRLVTNNRAVSSITMHFFGEIKSKRGRFSRPQTGASIELNGVRITFEDLGSIGELSDDEIHKCTEDYVALADTRYSTLLRSDPKLRTYSVGSLRAKCDYLIGRPSHRMVVPVAKLSPKVRGSRKR